MDFWTLIGDPNQIDHVVGQIDRIWTAPGGTSGGQTAVRAATHSRALLRDLASDAGVTVEPSDLATFKASWRQPDGPVTAHVEYAYSPRQGSMSNGGDHAVVDQPLLTGRLVRWPGQPLCSGKFWGLNPGGATWTGTVTCASCADRAERYGVDVQARPDM